MEKTYFIFTLPLFLILFTSCSMESIRENVDKEGENGFNFRESKLQWEKLKKLNGNSYFYVILEQSFTGNGSETTIVVKKGKVTSRSYEAFEIDQNDGAKTILYSYVEESKKELGSHPEGALPVTMDELYRSCISKYLIADPDSNEVHFETNEDGVMMLCGFVPYGCQDDCYRGFWLSHFEWR